MLQSLINWIDFNWFDKSWGLWSLIRCICKVCDLQLFTSYKIFWNKSLCVHKIISKICKALKSYAACYHFKVSRRAERFSRWKCQSPRFGLCFSIYKILLGCAASYYFFTVFYYKFVRQWGDKQKPQRGEGKISVMEKMTTDRKSWWATI